MDDLPLVADIHRDRRHQLLAAHPEIRNLIGREQATALWIAAICTMQMTIAALLANQPWWAALLAAYLVGALLALALWTLIHEAVHDLVFRSKRANRWLGIAAGLPLVVPTAASFRKYHLLHHRHPGHPVLDGDIPSGWEMRVICGSRLSRALWLFLMPLMQCLRPSRMPGEKLFDRWAMANLAVQLVFNVLVVWLLGWASLAYLLAANVFSLGLHPLGGRWLQEHLGQTSDQPTSSYYGAVNHLAFNAGYHVEHHDIAYVPWSRLPMLRRMASEFYDGLRSHRWWCVLAFRFLCARDPQLVWLQAADQPAVPKPEPVLT